MNRHAATFEAYYENSTDPWGYRTRWYEERKRALVLASLIRPRFSRAWEMGCSNGELTAGLSARCDELLATDGNERAVRAARARLAEYPNVRIEHAWHPRDWPAGRFDLILLGEIGYYLDPADLQAAAQKLRGSIRETGLVVACHWRHPIADCTLGGDAVHALLAHELRLPRLVLHREDDFLLEIWSADSRSVAQHEGLA